MRKRRNGTVKGVTPVGSGERTAVETPLKEGISKASDNPVSDSGLLVEASFIPRPRPQFVESPFGDRYPTVKPVAAYQYDAAVRLTTWIFDPKGYRDYGTVTSTHYPGYNDGEVLMQDWYGHVRDMGKRSLKYKHLPTSWPTDGMGINALMHWLAVYHYALANMTTLLNLNRLSQFSPALNVLATTWLPKYISRVQRNWRRLSATSAPALFKAHAIQGGTIYVGKDLVPHLRFWSPGWLPNLATGGPTIVNISQHWYTILTNDTHLANFILSLESAVRWLEIGHATIGRDNFLAFKDLVDMTRDIIPGSWEPGLPDQKLVPGLSPNPNLLTEFLSRAYFAKVDIQVGTDKWLVYPIPSDTPLVGRVPVMGFGTPSVYDYTVLGSPKFVLLDDNPTAYVADVNSPMRAFGTDFQIANGHLNAETGVAIESVFGASLGQITKETIVLYDGTTVYQPADVFVAEDLSLVQAWMTSKHLNVQHVLSLLHFLVSPSWAYWRGLLNNMPTVYLMWQEAEDMMVNYGSTLEKVFGVPYYK